MARERKKDSGGGGGCPAWLATYGDLVTLVLTFFILLYSFSSIDKEKWQQVVMSLSGGSSIISQYSPVDSTRTLAEREVIVADGMETAKDASSENAAASDPQQALSPGDIEKQERINEEFDKLYREIMAYVETNNLVGLMDVERQEGYVLLSFKEKMLFASGSAALNVEAQEFLSQIFMMLEGSQDSYRLMRIEGHTDNVPIQTANYKDNWDLSMDRAGTVLRFIQSGTQIDMQKFFAGGYGESRPIAENTTDEGRARNRRVDIICERRDLARERAEAQTTIVQ